MKKNTLMEYLLTELTIDIDPTDPNSMVNVKQKIAQAKQNPQRAAREQGINAKDELRTAQKSEGSPTKALDVKIAKLKQQLSMLQNQKMTASKRAERQIETVEYPKDICEVVYTDENDNILHEGSILTESAIQAFKRTGNVIKRQYRCTSGRKLGKVVANPNDCNKRKNPKLVKAGRISARKSKAIRVSKTKISKNKSISKMVTNLNKKLKG